MFNQSDTAASQSTKINSLGKATNSFLDKKSSIKNSTIIGVNLPNSGSIVDLSIKDTSSLHKLNSSRPQSNIRRNLVPQESRP